MAVTITGLTVHLHGTVGADITRLEIDAAVVAIAPDRTWTWSGTVPGGTRTVTVTAIGPSRIDARTVEIGSNDPPVGIG